MDFDRLAHGLLAETEVVETVRKWWGERVLDSSGRIDRQAIASIVFDDDRELARLEALLYPRLNRLCSERLVALQGDADVTAVVLDAPKLVEAGLVRLCDAVVFVDADLTTRLKRVTQLRGWDPAELERRENLQNPLDKKKASADYVVVNHGSIESLRPQVERVFKSVLASFT